VLVCPAKIRNEYQKFKNKASNISQQNEQIKRFYQVLRNDYKWQEPEAQNKKIGQKPEKYEKPALMTFKILILEFID